MCPMISVESKSYGFRICSGCNKRVSAKYQFVPGFFGRCPHCGAPPPENIEWFPPDDKSQDIIDPTELAAIEAGLIHCPVCNAANSSHFKVCGSCGSSLEGGKVSESVIRPDEEVWTAPTQKDPELARRSVLKCPKCGRENPLNSNTCAGCGAALKLENAAVSKTRLSPVSVSKPSPSRVQVARTRSYRASTSSSPDTGFSAFLGELFSGNALRRDLLPIAGLAFGALFIIFLLVLSFIPHIGTAQVVSSGWQCVTKAEHEELVDRSSQTYPSNPVGSVQSKEEVVGWGEKTVGYRDVTRIVTESKYESKDSTCYNEYKCTEMKDGVYTTGTCRDPFPCTVEVPVSVTRIVPDRGPIVTPVPTYGTVYYYKVREWVGVSKTTSGEGSDVSCYNYPKSADYRNERNSVSFWAKISLDKGGKRTIRSNNLSLTKQLTSGTKLTVKYNFWGVISYQRLPQ